MGNRKNSLVLSLYFCIIIITVIMSLLVLSRYIQNTITGHTVKIKEGNTLDSAILKTSENSAIIFETEDKNTTIYIFDQYLEHRKDNYNNFIGLAFFLASLIFIYLMSRLWISYKKTHM